MNKHLIGLLGGLLALLLSFGGYAAPANAAPAPTPPAALGPLPAGLPPTFWMGLGSQPGELGWMRDSGVPWNARYQYLTGGVNTGNGWATWWPGDGGFARDYMNASHAIGTLPVFTYYQLRYSQPQAGADEGEWDFTNLNNPGTMAAYFVDFALLLRQSAEYGQPVLVHVEPDFWGYMQRRVLASGNSAADIPAAVTGSGYPGVKGYPDTVQGFAQALLHLRDTLAPNVLLAIHASHWSTNVDISTSRDPATDPVAVGQTTAAFLNTAGIRGNPPGLRGWDLVFADPSDRDADWYRIMANDGGAHWWDLTDTTLPNFARYRAWLGAVSAGTGLRSVLWQVPMGNTVAASQNNAPGHFRDNRSVYFLGDGAAHLQSWIAAGVVGILWGRGHDQCTNYTDDGGYLRDQAAAYYKRGALPLPAAGAPVATPTPAPVPPVVSPPAKRSPPMRPPNGPKML